MSFRPRPILNQAGCVEVSASSSGGSISKYWSCSRWMAWNRDLPLEILVVESRVPSYRDEKEHTRDVCFACAMHASGAVLSWECVGMNQGIPPATRSTRPDSRPARGHSFDIARNHQAKLSQGKRESRIIHHCRKRSQEKSRISPVPA
jgi:hypothetical protein